MPKPQERRSFAVAAQPKHLDATLLRDGQALEDAWALEVAALLAMKRTKTAQAEIVANAAREMTGRIATRIETMRAMTVDGLKVKARAALWRRHGEPLENEARDLEMIAETDDQAGVAQAA